MNDMFWGCLKLPHIGCDANIEISGRERWTVVGAREAVAVAIDEFEGRYPLLVSALFVVYL